MKTVMAACLVVLVVGCQGPRGNSRAIVYAGGDGTSRESAVIIREAGCREAGTLAESMWLARTYPGYSGAKQSSVNMAGKRYDVVQFATSEGEARRVYFDTTEVSDR